MNKKTKQSQPKIGSNWVEVENSMPQKIVLERLIVGTGKSVQSTYTVKLKVWDKDNQIEYRRYDGTLNRDDLIKELVRSYTPYQGEEKYSIVE